MATKWKNKVALAIWLLLLTFGVSGIGFGLSQGGEYIHKDYFQTHHFENQLNQFIENLSTFELNYIPPESAKKAIVVTEEEINEHRFRYGDLPGQIANIKGQYEQKIQEALINNNKALVNIYIAERDQKVADITNNFKSDEHIRVKIVKEKEKTIDDFYRDMENQRASFLTYKAAFKYYLKDTTTGAVYTNLDTVPEENINDTFNFIRSYPSAKHGYLTTSVSSNVISNAEGLPRTDNPRLFEGHIAVPKSAPASNSVLLDYHNYQQQQRIFLTYTISALLALILWFYLNKKMSIPEIVDLQKWQRYYQRIPIDLTFITLAGIGLFTLVLLTSENPFYYYEYPYTLITETIFKLFFSAVFLALTLLQGKLLKDRVQASSLQVEWQKSLLYKAFQGIKEAFLIRSIGTQVVFLLAVVFGLGAGLIAVVVAPRVIILYFPFLIIFGIPASVLIVRSTGYFNRIVKTASDLAGGNFESDLPVVGKSVLAKLADSINTLKHGFKTSQKEQAKSERLKTELITNVSHDLRTPLTSIITYTELLKTPDLVKEDLAAYVEIIDRKSKRLKVLIDDLFEVSKMVSGNLELVKERVDLVQLLQQALAEHDEKISQSTLQFRVANPEKPLYAIVDGQKLWRVFDNLIGNILKYSLENTRVYITVKALPGKAVIVFKNVTKYELGEDTEELFERFKRGDTSRQTEGSGLGLAIAKSLIDLHGGKLDIEVDGDLFKLTISLHTMQE